MLIAMLFTVAKRCKQLTCPWTDNFFLICYIHTMEYYSPDKGRKFLTGATTWMNLEDIMVCEIIQSQKDMV